MTGISPEREAQIFARYAAGATTRAVSREFGIGSATASRAFQRFKAAQKSAPETPAASDPAEPDMTLTDFTLSPTGQAQAAIADAEAIVAEVLPAESLSALRERAVRLDAQHTVLLDRAAKIRQEIEHTDAGRIEALQAGADSGPFAIRRRDLEAEHARLNQDAGVVAGFLLEAGDEISRAEKLQRLGPLRDQLADLQAEECAVKARTGDRQRAVLAAYPALEQEWLATFADEAAAERAVADKHAEVAALCADLGEPVPGSPVPAPSTGLPTVNDAMGGPALAMTRAVNAGRTGRVMWGEQRIGELLAAANGFEPRPAVTAVELAAGQRAYHELIERNRLLLRGIKPLPAALQDGSASVSVDEHGHELRPVRPPSPADSWLAPAFPQQQPLVPPEVPGSQFLGR